MRGVPAGHPSRGAIGGLAVDSVDPANDISEFLTSRRARITPEPPASRYGKRRVPGLRREEVASLAGVSVEYYKRLEPATSAASPSASSGAGAGAPAQRRRARAPLELGEPVPAGVPTLTISVIANVRHPGAKRGEGGVGPPVGLPKRASSSSRPWGSAEPADPAAEQAPAPATRSSRRRRPAPQRRAARVVRLTSSPQRKRNVRRVTRCGHAGPTASRAPRRVCRVDVSGVAAALATTSGWPTISVAVVARVMAV